jgi:pimeloyl-ACP methyl ester carboxylesterase
MILHATDVGEGRPLALLHGLFGQGRNFGAAQRRLASAGRRVLALDLRNHGASPRAASMGHAEMADDVAGTLRARGALPAAVLGHSMGGKVAMALALRHPEAVERLVVADIAPRRYPPALRAYVAAMRGLPLREGMSRREADEALAPSVPDAGVRGFLLQSLDLNAEGGPRWLLGLDGIAASMPSVEGFDGVEGPPFEKPVLVLRGARSDYVTPVDRALFLRGFPRARFAEVPEAGHWLHADNPDAFVAFVEEFCA